MDATRTGAWNALNDIINTIRAAVAAVAIATDGFTLIGRVRAAGKVASVTFYPNAAVSGAVTNNRRYRLYNRTTGGGTVLIADLTLVNAVDLVAKTAKAITLTVTAADLNVAAGDLLEWKSDHNGTGIADPGGIVEVVITPTNA